MIVDVVAPEGEPVDLFAEGPSPEWALPVPMPVAGAPPGLRRFATEQTVTVNTAAAGGNAGLLALDD